MKDKTIDIFKFIIAGLLFLFMGKFISLIFNKLNFDINSFSFADLAYSEVLISLLLGIILFSIYQKILINDWYEFKKNLKNNLKKCLYLFGILIGVKLLSSIIIYLFGINLGINIVQSENQSVINLLLKSAPVMMFISAIFLAPFVEEVIFRLGLKKVIKSETLFIILSGFIFGLMHIFPTDINITLALVQSITYVSIGVLLAYYYVKYKNIYFIIIVHSLNNLLGMLAALLLI